jgi:uncharacterized membrane protein YccC
VASNAASAGALATVRRQLGFDPAGWHPVLALRAAAGVGLPLVIGLTAGNLTDGVIAAAGALPAGVAGYTGLRARWTLVLATTAGMTIATFLGSLTAGQVVPRTLALMAAGFIAGLCVTLGRSATLIGTQAIIGLAVFGRFPSSLGASGGHAALVAAGGVLQALFVGLRPPTRFSNERRAIAHALAQLAGQADGVASPGPHPAASAALAEAVELLDRRIDAADTEVLRGILDAAGRIRLELAALVTVRAHDGVVDLAGAGARRLRELSRAVAQGTVPDPGDGRLDTIAEQLRAAAEATAGRAGVGARYASARAQALLGQLRALDRQVAVVGGLRRFVLPALAVQPSPTLVRLGSRATGILHQLRLAATDRSASAWRHAVRLSLILAMTEVIAAIVPWQRGYWITLTAAVVLKPDYAATLQRGLARVVGTAVGAVCAGLIVDGLHPPETVEVALIAVLAWASYAVFAASYAAYSLVIGALVVVLLSPAGVGSLTTASDRGLSTLIGGAMALLAMFVWPTWERATLPDALRALVLALRDYADVILVGFVEPTAVDPAKLAAAGDEVRRRRAVAQASRDRAAAEPARVMADVSTATGVLSGGWRIVVALHSLRTTLEDSSVDVAIPEAERFRVALVDTLGDLATAHPREALGLREEQQRLSLAADDPRLPGGAAGWRARRLALLAVQLDPLVDSVDTLAHLLADGPSPGISASGER